MGLALDESDNSEDTVVQENDITVLADKSVKTALGGGQPLKVDFVDSDKGTGFIVHSGGCC